MKHYSAELNENNDVVSGSNLVIESTRVRGTAITAGSTDAIDGLILENNNFAHILDAQGSQFDPKDVTIDVLNYAKTASLLIDRDGDPDAPTATLNLYYNNTAVTTTASDNTKGTNAQAGISLDFAPLLPTRSGRVTGTNLELSSVTDVMEIDSNNIIATIDVSALAGGGGGAGASTNETDNIVPVKVTRGTQTAFADSTVTITNVDRTNAAGLESPYTGGTSFALTGAAIQAFVSSPRAGFGDGETVWITHPGNGGLIGAQQIRATVAGNSTAGNVTVTLSAANTDLATLAALNTAMFALTFDGTFSNAMVNGALTVTGDLTVQGDQTILSTTTTVTEDKYFAVNTSDSGTTPAQSVDGGFLVTKVTETAVQTGGSVAAGTGGLYAGIRFNEGATGNGVWEVSQGVAADGSADGAWTALSTHAGTVSKGVVLCTLTANGTTFGATSGTFNGTAAADTNDITVTNTPADGLSIQISVATGTEFPFNTDDLTVQIFENNSMIIPDSVVITGNTVDITIQNTQLTAGGANVVFKTVLVG